MSVGAQNLWNSMLIFDVFSECFWDRFWSGVGVVLGDFLVEMGPFVEMVVLHM